MPFQSASEDVSTDPGQVKAMRTLVGIDDNDLYVSAIRLLARLGFHENRLTLAHVDPLPGVILNPEPLVYAYYDAQELDARLRSIGETLLREAVRQTEQLGLGKEIHAAYERGNSSAVLMRLADEQRSDLIAVGSGHHGGVQSFFLGSVGRSLAIGAKQSFLVARNLSKTTGPVRAIFATDFSDYAERAFHRLLDMDIRGFEKVTILVATDFKMESRLVRELELEGSSPNPLTDVEERMSQLGERMADQLKARGIDAEFLMIEGHASEVLPRMMAETDSELLIMGARGHGLIERVLVGSLTLHQVVAEHYSVLVLRLPEEL